MNAIAGIFLRRMTGPGFRGFTLIEMCLVVALVGVVGVAVYQSLASGLKIWERTQRFNDDEDVSIFLDKITRDLHNSFPHSLTGFDGKAQRLSFATLVWTPGDPKSPQRGSYHDQIGRAEYYFDPAQRAVLRRQAGYGQALKKQYGKGRVLAGSIMGLKFSYVFFNPDDNFGDEVVKPVAKDIYPYAVMIELSVLEGGGRVHKVTRRVNLPVQAGV